MKSRHLLPWKIVPIFFMGLLCGCGENAPTSELTLTSTPQPHARRVACVGDSITFGLGVADLVQDPYPSLLGKWLGPKYDVRNAGVSGSTMLNSGNLPYQQQNAYGQALQFKPDILTVAMGTNDSRYNFDSQTKINFARDYKELISAFRAVNPRVKVYVCLPPPSYTQSGKMDLTLKTQIIPLIRKIAADTGAQVIDLYTPLSGNPQLFFDDLHPNSRGARLIATHIYQGLSGKTAPTASDQ